MKMKDLNKLSKEIYEANKAKGFHDVKHSQEHMLCLVISELMEAVEADRKGRTFNQAGCTNDFEHFYRDEDRVGFKDAFKNNIKDTVADELADAVIRLLDTAGALGVCLQRNKNEENNVLNSITKLGFNIQSFTESIYSIIRVFMLSEFVIGYRISSMISHIDLLCEVMEIDLWQHVELKLKYNSLRPYKHGKQY